MVDTVVYGGGGGGGGREVDISGPVVLFGGKYFLQNTQQQYCRCEDAVWAARFG